MDNLDKAASAAELASQATEGVAESGVVGAKAAATTSKVAAGFSLLSTILSAFKTIFGKK